jgi:uncharacterized Zn-binding protein involved in type VI secretion
MPGVQRVGDRNTAGGLILTGDPSVLINGRPIALAGASVSPHPCCGAKGCPPVHCNAKTLIGIGSNNVLVNGRPIALAGSPDSCGHVRSVGSRDVLAG